jgi:hypothetical protein
MQKICINLHIPTHYQMHLADSLNAAQSKNSQALDFYEASTQKS